MQLRRSRQGEYSHASILAVAFPIMLSGATTPLVGFVDTMVIGRLGQAHLIGAVAVSANVFSLVYWLFGFLRMGTTGLTAQAVGAGDAREVASNLYRPALIALCAGLGLILLQWPIAAIAFWCVGASAEVEVHAREYYAIRIWAAPVALINYVLVGWMIGRARAMHAFLLQLLLNLTNLALSVVFVVGLGAAVAGVAWAAVIAECIAATVGLYLAHRHLGQKAQLTNWARVADGAKLRALFNVNADILVRTLCLLLVFFFFTAQGARSGDVVLAANAILHSMALITVYLLDGYATAAETFVGQSVGARDWHRYRSALCRTSLWAGMTALVMSLALWVSGPAIIAVMTTSEEVRKSAESYLIWPALTPIVGVWCFQLDGVFVGATRSADMRNMMLLSAATFFAVWALLHSAYGNHGLWMAVMTFYAVRAFALAARLPALERAIFANSRDPLRQR